MRVCQLRQSHPGRRAAVSRTEKEERTAEAGEQRAASRPLRPAAPARPRATGRRAGGGRPAGSACLDNHRGAQGHPALGSPAALTADARSPGWATSGRWLSARAMAWPLPGSCGLTPSIPWGAGMSSPDRCKAHCSCHSGHLCPGQRGRPPQSPTGASTTRHRPSFFSGAFPTDWHVLHPSLCPRRTGVPRELGGYQSLLTATCPRTRRPPRTIMQRITGSVFLSARFGDAVLLL